MKKVQGGDPLHQLLPGMVSALYLQNRLLPQHLSGNRLRQYERQHILYSVYLQCAKRNGWVEDFGGVQLDGEQLKAIFLFLSETIKEWGSRLIPIFRTPKLK